MEAFWDMRQSGPSGMSGPEPLPISEFIAWQQVTGFPLRADEIATLRRMDLAYVRESRKLAEADQQQAESKDHISSRPMTPALFDALF
jgi:hypothetical protein